MVSVSGFVGEIREVSVEDGAGRGRMLQLGCTLVRKREQAVWSAVIRAWRKQTRD